MRIPSPPATLLLGLVVSSGCSAGDVGPGSVAIAAAVLNRYVHWGIFEQQEAHPQARGHTSYEVEEPGCYLENCEGYPPEWTGDIGGEVTWDGDPSGICNCDDEGTCLASEWSFEAEIDVVFCGYPELDSCYTDDEIPDPDPPDFKVRGTVSGLGGHQRGPETHCELSGPEAPDTTAAGTLTVGGLFDAEDHEVEVTRFSSDYDDGDEVTVDGTTWTWWYYCGS